MTISILSAKYGHYEISIDRNYEPVPDADFYMYVRLALSVISRKQSEIPYSQSFLT